MTREVRRVRSADVPGPADAIVVPSQRDPAFLAELVAELNRIAGPLRSLIPGVDLAEVAIYEWTYAAAPFAHHAWVASQHPEAQLAWITDDSPGAPRRPSLKSRVSRALHLRKMQAAVRDVRRRVREARRPSVPIARADRRLLLIDQYAHTARLLGDVGGVVARGSDVDVLAVGTDAAVTAACEPFVDAVALADASARTTRRRAARVARQVAKVPLPDELFDQAAPGFADASRRALALAAKHAVLVEGVLSAASPVAIATTSIVASSARAAALIGRAHGIPCAWVQHGILRTDDWKTRYTQDRFLCWGERDRRKLISAGIDASVVTVTGSSQFEDLGARAGSQPSDDGTLRVLYLPSRSGGNLVSLSVAAAMVRSVVDAVDKLPDAKLTVKPHPGDTSSVFDNLGDRILVARGADLVASVLAADVVVVATSTAGLEACALDRPVIALAFEGIDLAGEYADYEAALIARDADEVFTSLVAIADADVRARLAAGRKAMVDDLFDGLRPGAARRCAGELVRLTGGSPLGGTDVAVEWLESDAEPSWRDPAWRDGLGDLVDAALPLLADVLAPIEVLEAGRYDWFHRLAPIAHRAWALEKLVGEGATHIVWHVDGQAPAGLATALRAAANGRATIHVRTTDPRPRVLSGHYRRPSLRSSCQKPAGAPPQGSVVFVEAFPRGASVSASIAAQLPQTLPVHCITTSGEIAGGLDLAGLSPVMLPRAATRRARLRAELAAQRVRSKVNAATKLLTDPATSPWGAVAPALAAGLEQSLYAFVDSARTSVLVTDVVARWKPAVVASSTGAPAVVRAAATAARSAGRHSVFIQHGLLLLYRYRRHLCHDTFLVWGPADRRQLAEAGIPENAIHVCGAPQFDALAARRVVATPRADDGFRVLYLPSRTGGRFVSDDQARVMLQMVRDGVPPWAELRIKPHPSDKGDLFAGSPNVLPRTADPLDEIIAADAVVIATSTVGVEAAALGRPVIVLGLPGVVVPEELTGYEVTTVVTSASELSHTLTDIRDGGEAGAAARAALVDDMLDGLVPGAAQRAAAVITAFAND